MPPSLAEIVENKRLEVTARRRRAKPDCFQSIVPGKHRFASALRRPGLNFICELKPKSPSAGVLQQNPAIATIIPTYDRFASAISVLTDEKYFGGSLAMLTQVAQLSKLPVLCKDFVVDEFQCYEARMAGAEAILLMVKILDKETLCALYACTVSLGMSAVVEVQTGQELAQALELAPEIILINNRNLENFEIDFQTTVELAPSIPDSIIKISASGIGERADIERLMAHCSNFLVGSSLMSATNIEAKLKDLTRLSTPQAQV
jgi:indole-3-glycerol phosphate synthase/phosphoribosylanthranilate isomerase